jgi:ubiquinone/menaquinone biosynthesis C-methylase UbiE
LADKDLAGSLLFRRLDPFYDFDSQVTMKIDIEAAALSKFVQITAPSDKSVLEIGFGTGRLTFLLAFRLLSEPLRPGPGRPRGRNAGGKI